MWTNKKLINDDENLEPYDAWLAGPNFMMNKNIQKEDIIIIFNIDTNSSIGPNTCPKRALTYYYPLATKTDDINMSSNFRIRFTDNNIITLENLDKNESSECSKPSYENSTYLSCFNKGYEPVPRGGVLTYCPKGWDETFFNIKDENKRMVSVQNLKYGTPYYIYKTKEPKTRLYMSSSPAFLIDEDSEVKNSLWIFYPYIEVEGLDLNCIFIDWNMQRRNNILTPDNLSTCVDKYINFCSSKNKMFTGRCKYFISENKQHMSMIQRQKLDKNMVKNCSEDEENEDCVCLHQYEQLKDKNIYLGSTKIKPHCFDPKCSKSNTIYVTKEQDMNNKCPIAECVLKNIKDINIGDSNVIQLCDNKIEDEKEKEDAGNGNWKFLPYIIIAIIIVLIIVLVLKNKQ